jgi:acetyl esterase/lipase
MTTTRPSPQSLTLRSVLIAIIRALTYPLRSTRCTALYNDVLYAAIRCMLDRITIPQSRYLQKSTSEAYLTHCKDRNVAPETVQIEVGDGKRVAGHWIGSSKADTVIYYLHGGGYTQPASEGNYKHAVRLLDDLNAIKGQRSIALLMLDYTLVPDAIYPTQLREAVAGLAHLLTETGRKPSDIFISGDSAGGNLAVALLSHILHPHPDVPAVEIDKPLGGALLYSPWVGFSTDYPSFDNYRLDMMSALVLRKWSAMLLNKSNPSNPEADPGPISGDAYTEACKNLASWWKGMHSVCSDIFLCYGSDEVLADAIKEWESPLKKGWIEGGGDASRIVFIQGAREAHVAPILDAMKPGANAKSSTQTAIEEWYKARLRQ